MPKWWSKYGLKYWHPRTSKAVKPETIIRQWNDNLMLGKVVKTSTIGVGQQACAQVAVTRNEYNNHLHMFFPNESSFWALDDRKATGTDRTCSLGDIVLIRKLADPFTLKVTHRIEKRVFEHGKIIDPVSGTRLFGAEYEELRKARTNVVKEVIGQKLSARQLAAARLSGRTK